MILLLFPPRIRVEDVKFGIIFHDITLKRIEVNLSTSRLTKWNQCQRWCWKGKRKKNTAFINIEAFGLAWNHLTWSCDYLLMKDMCTCLLYEKIWVGGNIIRGSCPWFTFEMRKEAVGWGAYSSEGRLIIWWAWSWAASCLENICTIHTWAWLL